MENQLEEEGYTTRYTKRTLFELLRCLSVGREKTGGSYDGKLHLTVHPTCKAAAPRASALRCVDFFVARRALSPVDSSVTEQRGRIQIASAWM